MSALLAVTTCLPLRSAGCDQLARDSLAAADELDDDVGVRRRRQRGGVILPPHAGEIDAAVAPPIARRDRDERELAPGAPFQQFGVLAQQAHGAGADGAEPGNGDLQWRLHVRSGPLPAGLEGV